jgi:hypothetical protein
MRQLLFAVACLVLTSCEDILPVQDVDLCEGDEPASAECEQCTGERKPAGCPQCRNGSPAPGCENGPDSGGGGSGSGGAGPGGGMDGGKASIGGDSGSTGGAGSSGSGDSGSGGSGTGGSGGSSGTGMSGSGGEGATGGSSGDGGSAGSAVPLCDSHDDCEATAPRCMSGKCVACISNSACTGRPEGQHCDRRPGSAHRGQCVPCTAHSHCGDPATPECNESGQCGACTGDDGCVGRVNAPKCDTTEGSSSKGHCVQCLTHSDCPDSTAPQCSSHVCGACTGDAACTGRPDAHACDVSGSAPYSGTCVQCTVDNEADCGPDVCTPSTRTCATGHTKASQGTCQPCVADSECVGNHRCIPMQFMGADRDNPYCLTLLSATCTKPYASASINRESVSGAPADDYCGITESKTTCEAVLSLIADATCPGGADTECAADGSICRSVNGAPSHCTYACTISAECPDPAPCRSGYCGGPP